MDRLVKNQNIVYRAEIDLSLIKSDKYTKPATSAGEMVVEKPAINLQQKTKDNIEKENNILPNKACTNNDEPFDIND